MLNSRSTARFFSPSGQTVQYTTSKLEALVVDRIGFDRALERQTRAAGAVILFGAKATAVDVGSRDVAVHCRDRAPIRDRTCVLACGANYAFQRRLGLGIPSLFLKSAQMEMPAGRSGDVEVFFGHDVAPKGFAWVVPVHRGRERYARVGLMCDGDAGLFFRRLVASAAPSWGLRPPDCEDVVLAPRQKILPLAPIRRTYADRVLAIGDAAGLVKATTGGGIYYALVSAATAAAVLDTALGRDALAADQLRVYEKEWRRRLGSELRAQLALRMLAHRLSDDDIEALFELARTDGVMPIVRRTAQFNHHRDLIVSLFKHPPARRLLFKQFMAKSFALSAS